MQAQNGQQPNEEASRNDDVAIIGIGCRFPGAVNDAGAFWKMLEEARDCTSFTPKDRYDVDYFYYPTRRTDGKMYNERGGYVDSTLYRQFDRQFFRMPPSEANHLDPQIRMLLETTWEALEDAGVSPSSARGSNTGVYVGVTSHEYSLFTALQSTTINPYTNSGSNVCMTSNRVSYEFDFRGPSYTIDTACSSSLYAVHQACEGLRRGDCDMAVAGGVNLLLLPSTSIGFCQAEMLSPDGRSKSFDASADGYARSEGSGVVILKSLQKALDDGDPIYAVVRGGAMTNDGKTQGIAQPSYDAQVELVEKAHDRASVRPGDITYVEAHGTGTKAGDSTEANALGEAIGRARMSSEPPLYIGSVKSNFGHTEGASGVAGVIKSALMLAKRRIPPVANFRKPNPNIRFDELHLEVPSRVLDWPTSKKATMGCSSFGFGGANIHVVLEESPVTRRVRMPTNDGDQRLLPENAVAAEETNDYRLLLLSAASSTALKDLANSWVKFIDDHLARDDAFNFADVLYTAALRAQHHRYRLVLVVRNAADARRILLDFLEGKTSADASLGTVAEGSAPMPIVFAFSGMGTQWWAMGRQLVQDDPMVNKLIKKIDCLLQEEGAAWSLLDVLLSSEEGSILSRTEIAQPCIFALEIAILENLREFGISPSAVVGHSVGEVAAAYAAGFLTLKQAVKVIYHRGQQLSTTSGEGKMLAVLGDVQEALETLPRRLFETETRRPAFSVAAVNSSQQIVLSGDEAALQEAASVLEKKDAFKTIYLKVNNAFHSFQQSRLERSVLEKLDGLALANGNTSPVSMVSTVTADYVDGEKVASASYWWSNIRNTVRFKDAVELLLKDGHACFVEIGAHSALTPAIRQITNGHRSNVVAIPTLKRPKDTSKPAPDDKTNILRCVAQLHVSGVKIDFSRMYPPGNHSVFPLPLYPWQRETCWIETAVMKKLFFDPLSDVHPLLGRRQVHGNDIRKGNNSEIVWKSEYSSANLPWLKDHVIQDTIITPAAAFVETALAVGTALFEKPSAVVIKDARFERFLAAPNSSATVYTVAEKSGQNQFDVRIHTEEGTAGSWQTHAQLTVERCLIEEEPEYFDLEGAKKRCTHMRPAEKMYSMSAGAAGFRFGPSFQVYPYMMASDDFKETFAPAEIPEEIRRQLNRYVVHPALLDGVVQSCQVFQRELLQLSVESKLRDIVRVPTKIGKVRLLGDFSSRLWVYSKSYPKTINEGCGDIIVARADDLRIVMKLESLVFSGIGDVDMRNLWSLDWTASNSQLDAERADLLSQNENRRGALVVSYPEWNENFLAKTFEESNVRVRFALIKELSTKGVRNEIHEGITDVVLPLYNINARLEAKSPLVSKEEFLAAVTAGPLAVLKTINAGWSTTMRDNKELKLWVVTRKSQLISNSDEVDFVQSSALGSLLALAHECQGIRAVFVDLPGSVPDVVASRLFLKYFLNPLERENEVAIRPTSKASEKSAFDVLVPRLMERDESSIVSQTNDANWTLKYSAKTKKATFGPATVGTPRDLNAGSVRITVEHFAPLEGAGSESERSGALSVWISGFVIAVGAGVASVKAGDTVIGFANEVSQTIEISSAQVVRKPKNVLLSSSDLVYTARSLFAPFVTFSVSHPLKKGNSVLVWTGKTTDDHLKSATAISKVVRSFESSVVIVHASETKEPLAGMPESSEVFSLDTVSRLPEKSFDSIVLLDSIVGDDAKLLLGRLKLFGSCIHCKDALPWLAKLKKSKTGSVTYSSLIDELDLISESGPLAGEVLAGLMKSLEEERLTPCTEAVLETLTNVSEATLKSKTCVFATRTESKEETAIPLGLPGKNSFVARPDEKYLITGGLKGFGLALADWLVSRGAKHLVLLGRSRPREEEERRIDALKEKADVDLHLTDITDEKAVDDVFEKIVSADCPLAGIFHCAAVYKDRLAMLVTGKDMEDVVLPKGYGAWLLHQQTMTRGLNLRYFVLFSSTISLFGNVGQMSYATANVLLNSLAVQRRALGLPAVAIQFGAIADAGYLTRNPTIMQSLGLAGLTALDVETALDFMGRALLIGLPSLCVQGEVDHESYLKMFQKPIAFSRLKGIESLVSAKETRRHSSSEFAAASDDEKKALAFAAVSEMVKEKAGLTEFPDNVPIVSLGIDSLAVTEISNRIKKMFDVVVPTVRLLSNQCTVTYLSDLIVTLFEGENDAKEQLDVSSSSADRGSQWTYRLNEPETINCELICFPPNAGGKSHFSRWGVELEKASIAVTVLQIPGWEGRETEKLIETLEELVAAAVEVVLPIADKRRVAFYGHSFGALIAYEVSLYLKEKHDISPVHLFIGAWHAPHIPYPHPTDFAFFSESSKPDELLEWSEKLSFVDFPTNMQQRAEMFLFLMQRMPAFKVALDIVGKYAGGEQQVPCSMDVFAATNDKFASIENVKEWQRQSALDFHCHIVDGKHQFTNQQSMVICAIIMDTIEVYLK